MCWSKKQFLLRLNEYESTKKNRFLKGTTCQDFIYQLLCFSEQCLFGLVSPIKRLKFIYLLRAR